MTGRRWGELSPGAKKFIVVSGAVEALLKIAALRDLKGRSSDELRGRKWVWALALTFGNTMGALPVAYFLVGRRKASDAE